MARVSILKKSTSCHKCIGRMWKTDWLPEDGLNPRLREYKCDICDTVEYIETTEPG